MTDRASDIPLAVHGETTVISYALSLRLPGDTSTLSCSRPGEFHMQPNWLETRRSKESRGGARDEETEEEMQREE